MNSFTLFLLMLKASLFSSGGMGNVPSLHNDLISRNWSSERQFVEALAVGQVSPGPNGLWVVSLGYLVDGVPGSLIALLAILLPPLLVLAVERLYRRMKHHPAVEGFVHGLSLAVVGVFAVVLVELLRGVGMTPQSVSIALVGAGLSATRRVPVIGIITLAAIAGIVLR